MAKKKFNPANLKPTAAAMKETVAGSISTDTLLMVMISELFVEKKLSTAEALAVQSGLLRPINNHTMDVDTKIRLLRNKKGDK